METHPVGGSRRALIVDDDPMVGVLLDNLVGSFGFTTGRARTVSEARKMLKSLDPDVALVDIDLGHGPSGLDFARILGKSHPHVGIVFLSRFSEADSGVHSLKGIPDNVAYLSKLELHDTQVVQDTIEECLRPSLEVRRVSQERLELSGLTPAQYDLVVKIAAGLSPSDIAQAQNKSVRTIELMMNRIQEQHPEIVLDSKRTRTESAARFLESSPT